MFTSLLGNVSTPNGSWVELLELTLDPGVWLLWGTTLIDSDALFHADFRFTDGSLMYGSASAPLTQSTLCLGVADLSLALIPTVIKYQAHVDWTGGNTFARALAGSAFTNTATATWMLAVTDKSAEIDQILAAVTRTFPPH